MTEISDYLKNIIKGYLSGISTEHSYRGDLKDLINNLVKGIVVTNEPKRQKCGAPDYIIQVKEIPIGYIEVKDVGNDLNKTEKSEQMKRYLASLDNLILSDYFDFRFFRNGQKVKEIRLATIENNKIKVNIENFQSFITHIDDFCGYKGQTIKSSEQLAKMMAQKARMMEEVIFNAVKEDDENNSLRSQLEAFRQILIHDLDEKTFSDIYAQTIAYGLFAARLHDKTIETFSREEALFLIPKSNPFLRQLFTYVAGPELDDRVVWIVNDLADIFRATDLKELLADFGKATGQNDPFIHFYETFLGEYDAALRKSRGVYYTPEPAVNFIVRAVDDILKEEFKIPQGLADSSKIKIKAESETTGKKIDKEVHKVQILDPATGTGTFLAEVVKLIYKKFEGQEGIWANYIEEHLIPRLNGFEILMASYTMCHLKLEALLTETGYKPKDESKQKRLRVFLTNSLEAAHPYSGTLFANWLSKEATEANVVKQETPVMVVIGNPPYSGESANKGEWIMNLMEDYKKEPGGVEKLQEQNSKWINDDYVKFIRYGQYFIDKNREGILAFINNHSFLDNPTFRGMRWNLLKSFDKIYIIDLHGNAKKKEVCPDGSKDENVFDIQQGVSINIFIKTGKKKRDELGKVYHSDLYGERAGKYKFLWENNLKTVKFNNLEYSSPQYFFVKKDFDEMKNYNLGFSVVDLFPLNNVGIVTSKDSILINDNIDELIKNVEEYYKIKADKNLIKQILYRPFDDKFIYYDIKIIERAREKIMRHFIKGENIGLIFRRQQLPERQTYYFISKNIIADGLIRSDNKGGESIAPLYLYPEDGSLEKERKPNLNMEIVNKIAEKLGLRFAAERIPLSPFEKGGNSEDDGSSSPLLPFEKGGNFEDGGFDDEHSSSPLSQRGFRGLDEFSGIEKQNPDMKLMPFNSELKERARGLRNNTTEAEKKIWLEILSNDKMLGLRFLRQKPLLNFIADFYCSKLMIVIEIDGDTHDDEKAKIYDEERTKSLETYGIKVIRYKNNEIYNNLDWVYEDLKNKLEKRILELSKKDHPETFAPIDILDYIYAVLHSPKYREKYKEFLKIDFPRVPYPENADIFWKLVKLGGEIRTIHLLENPVVEKFITTFPVNGDNKVVKVTFNPLELPLDNGYVRTGKVWINSEQYFDKVPEIAWNFYIGGYQPAQKWLKDRKNRALNFEDIIHYQKIIVALNETDGLMKEIDKLKAF